MSAQNNQKLEDVISYVIRDICELHDRTSPEDRPNAMIVEPYELREILRHHFGDIFASLPFNQLTPAEAERLFLLIEEVGESLQATGKVLRHGYESTHPDGGPTNRQSLEREFGDTLSSMRRLCFSGDLSPEAINRRADQKTIDVCQYLHHL